MRFSGALWSFGGDLCSSPGEGEEGRGFCICSTYLEANDLPMHTNYNLPKQSGLSGLGLTTLVGKIPTPRTRSQAGVCMYPFAMEMAAIFMHSLNRFSLCTKMAAVVVAKLLLCCDIMQTLYCNSSIVCYITIKSIQERESI